MAWQPHERIGVESEERKDARSQGVFAIQNAFEVVAQYHLAVVAEIDIDAFAFLFVSAAVEVGLRCRRFYFVYFQLHARSGSKVLTLGIFRVGARGAASVARALFL